MSLAPPPETADRGRFLFFALATADAQLWAGHAVHLGCPSQTVATVNECRVLARSETPTVIVAPRDAFDRRLVDRTDEAFRRTTLVVLTDDPEELDWWRMIAWQAAPTTASGDAAEAALASALAEAARRLDDALAVEDYQRRLGDLSPDESKVFVAVCAGRLNKQIANDLQVSIRTVEQRRRRVFDKMGVDSATPLSALRARAQTLEDQWRRSLSRPAGDRARRVPPAPPPSPRLSGEGVTLIDWGRRPAGQPLLNYRS